MKKIRFLLLTSSLAVALSVGHVATGHAAESDLPAHGYSAACSSFTYWGNYVTAMPTVLNTYPGVGIVTVNGPSNPYAYTHQNIYYRLWVYSYSTGKWSHSAYKRITDGVILNPSEFNARIGAWTAPAAYLDSSNFAIGTTQVGVRVGSGRQYVQVETYWEQPTTEWTNTDPNPGPGWRHYDFLGICTF